MSSTKSTGNDNVAAVKDVYVEHSNKEGNAALPSNGYAVGGRRTRSR